MERSKINNLLKEEIEKNKEISNNTWLSNSKIENMKNELQGLSKNYIKKLKNLIYVKKIIMN